MSLFAGSLTTGNLFNGGLFYSENGEIFNASLTTALVQSTGNFSPTFTRNTTASVTDFEGIIRTAKVGEARFKGARRVENMLSYSEDIGNGANVKYRTSVISNATASPNGMMTADKLVEGSSTGTHAVTNSANIGALSVIGSVFAKAGERTKIGFGSQGGLVINAKFDLSSGTYNYNPSNYVVAQPLENGWYRLSVKNLSGSLVGPYVYILDDSWNLSYSGNGTSGIYIWGFQLEDITGKSVQTVGDYVSAGVLSAPYHGTGADSVKYFDITLDGTPITTSVLKGYFSEGQRTNLALYSNDFSNAAWVKSNLTQASGTLTATAANGTILQTVTSTSQAHTFSIQIKRKTGTGNVDITIDNGATWVTKAINSDWESYEVTQTLANPVFGVRIETSGDEIYIRYGGLEKASFSSSPILTTSASVTRNKDDLKYQLGLPANGTIYAEVYSKNSNVGSGIVSKSLGIGPLNYNSDTGISFIDGTNTHVLTYGQPFSTGIRKIAARWSGSAGTMKLFKDGGASPEGAYNGGFNGGTEILIGQNNFFGCIRNIKIWPRVLSDNELMSMTL